MKELNLRKKNFYNSALRSFFVLLALILFLAVVPQIDMLQNQKVKVDKEIITGVEIAKVLISLIIVGVLLNFAYISESQLPKIVVRIPQIGLIISSVIHVVVIFIAYFYLLPFATDRLGNVNQIFNAVFLLLLCVPLIRGGKALYEGINQFTDSVTSSSFDEKDLSNIKCEKCGATNDKSAKHCFECGNKLITNNTTSQYVVCKICNTQNDPSAKHCTECGNKLQEANNHSRTIACPQCGTENKLGVKHCSECGTDLTKTSAKQT